jgi:hypothetical protein
MAAAAEGCVPEVAIASARSFAGAGVRIVHEAAGLSR